MESIRREAVITALTSCARLASRRRFDPDVSLITACRSFHSLGGDRKNKCTDELVHAADDVAHRPSFRSQTVHDDGSYALLRPRLLNISLSIHAEGQNNRHQGRTSCSQLKPDWSAELWAEQRNVPFASASHTHTYLTIERHVMNQNKPPQSATQSTSIEQTKNKKEKEFVCDARPPQCLGQDWTRAGTEVPQ